MNVTELVLVNILPAAVEIVLYDLVQRLGDAAEVSAAGELRRHWRGAGLRVFDELVFLFPLGKSRPRCARVVLSLANEAAAKIAVAPSRR